MKFERASQPGSQKDATTHSNEPDYEAESFEYKFFPDVRQRMLLGEAVEKMVDLVVEVNKNEGQDESEPSVRPNVIFLDKSARPLVVTFRRLWSKKYPDKSVPNISYLNIGREITETGKDNVWRELHVQREVARIQKEYLYLNEAQAGSTIIIVDDITNTGSSGKAALAILHEAFPSLKFKYQALTKARKENILISDYKKLQPKLFDNKANMMGTETGYMTTIPPWNSGPTGITGVVDYYNDPYDPDNDVHLTAKPYYKHKKYTKEARVEAETKYSKAKERMESTLKIIAEGCQELVDWEPSTTSPSPSDGVVLFGLKQLKDKGRAFLEALPNVDKIGVVELGNIAPRIDTIHQRGDIKFLYECEYKGEYISGTPLQEQIIAFLGIPGYGGETRPGSVAEKINEFGFLYDISYREKFDRLSQENKIVELTQTLRLEMQKIADEYWEQKTKT